MIHRTKEEENQILSHIFSNQLVTRNILARGTIERQKVTFYGLFSIFWRVLSTVPVKSNQAEVRVENIVVPRTMRAIWMKTRRYDILHIHFPS